MDRNGWGSLLLLGLVACAGPPETESVKGSYAVVIGSHFMGEAAVSYRLVEGPDGPLLRIESQAVLEGNGQTLYDSTRVDLDPSTMRPRSSRKIILAGEERKAAEATYGTLDSLVELTTHDVRGTHPLYLPADTVLYDKEQLTLGLGLLEIGLETPEAFRVISADLQRQLAVVVEPLERGSIVVPAGTFPSLKVRMGVRPNFLPEDAEPIEHEVFLWLGDDGRLLRYHDPELEALWMLTEFEGTLAHFRALHIAG